MNRETRSPFPGMDPYTEARHLWQGLHKAETERLVTVIEILSFSNKTSGAEKRARYLLKRQRTFIQSLLAKEGLLDT